MRNIEEQIFETNIPAIRDIREHLETHGWAKFDGMDLSCDEVEMQCLTQLSQYAESLPTDCFGGGGRHRSYAEGIVTSERRTVVWKPGFVMTDGTVEIDYRQEVDFQPEYGGVSRRFRRTDNSILTLPIINKLIWFDLALTPMSTNHKALLCGFHLIRMQAFPGVASKITPNCLHQDGQPFTAVHLIDRFNANGGINYIAPPQYIGNQIEDVPEDLVSAFVLNSPLESYIIDDAAVSHYVTPILCTPGAPNGVRTVILIDFSPLDSVRQ